MFTLNDIKTTDDQLGYLSEKLTNSKSKVIQKIMRDSLENIVDDHIKMHAALEKLEQSPNGLEKADNGHKDASTENEVDKIINDIADDKNMSTQGMAAISNVCETQNMNDLRAILSSFTKITITAER